MIIGNTDRTILGWSGGETKEQAISTYLDTCSKSDLVATSIKGLYAAIRFAIVNGKKSDKKMIKKTLRLAFGEEAMQRALEFANAQSIMADNLDQPANGYTIESIAAYSRVLQIHGEETTRKIGDVVLMLAACGKSHANLHHLDEAEKLVTERSLVVNPKNKKTLVPEYSVK
ncbi:hypothetical protein ACFOEW_15780 [Alteromonas oceani]|uniref:Uncharacterized protein n=1 Tax=Alteromonas oceani TaxID=2071609 RepID=A0ABV7K1K3_9ALTE|nr:hypothetical protein [Alteromonas oceani]